MQHNNREAAYTEIQIVAFIEVHSCFTKVVFISSVSTEKRESTREREREIENN